MDPKGKNVYISGPITGRPLHNAPAFAEAHAMLRELGAAEVLNPTGWWFRDQYDLSHEQYMRRCLRELTSGDLRPNYDAIVMLDGFEDSDGAQVELAVAEAVGIDVLTVADLREAWEARNE